MSPKRIGVIARQELRTHVRSPLLWALAGCTAFATLTIDGGSMTGAGAEAFGNSRFALARAFSLTGLLFYGFFVSILAGMSVPRDRDSRVGELLHSTPLTPGEYVCGKLAGILAAALLAITFHAGLAILWSESGALFGAPAVHGPFQLGNFLFPALAFLVPGAVFCAGVSFAVGARTRSAMAVWAVPVALFTVGILGLSTAPSRGFLDALFTLLDPWGTRWLSENVFRADRGAAFYNTAPLPFDAAFIGTRLFLLSLAIGAVVLATRHLRSTLRGEGGTPSRRPAVSEPVSTAAFLPLGDLGMTARPPGLVAATLEVARVELRGLAVQPGPYLFGAFALLLVVEAAGTMRGVFDSEVLLSAGGLAVSFVPAISALGCLLLLVVVAESLDRGRRHRVDGLVRGAPVPTAALLYGPLLAAAVLVCGLVAGCGLVGLALVALRGEASVDPAPFALVWGLLLAPTFLVFASFVLAAACLVRDRLAVYAIGLAALFGTAALQLSGSMTWVSNWPLWGALRASDLGAFEMDGLALLLNRLTMLALAAFLSSVAFAVFRRTEHGRPAAQSWARLATFAFLVAVPAGALAYGVHTGPSGGEARARDLEYWRLNVATWANAPLATLTRVDVRVALEPRDRRLLVWLRAFRPTHLRVDGTFTLVNETGTALERLPFTVGPAFRGVRWSVDGAAASAEDRSGLHLVKLASPLGTGKEAVVGFGYDAVFSEGLTRSGGGISEFVLPSGVQLNTLGPNFLPVPGFLEGIGVDRDNRVEPREELADAWTGELPPVTGARGSRPITSRMEISAPSEYTVNAVGDKTSERTANGKTTVVFEADGVRFLNLLAGRWAVRRGEGAAVFHHPAHGANADEILKALVAARRHYSDWFAPYPWKELRLSEVPDHVTRAQSFPTNISMSEGMGFRTAGGGLRLPTIVTAHEAAHQWWGHLLTPGRHPGADVLIEGMANYATLRFLEAEHGVAARVAFARKLEERYLDARRVDAELPLARLPVEPGASDETVSSEKGAWVLWMLEQQVGRERMQDGLRAFIERFRGSLDHPALPDLIETLRPADAAAAAARDFQAFVDSWFFDVVLPEIRVRDVDVQQIEGGSRVAATLENVGTGTVRVVVSAMREVPSADARTSVALAPGRPRRIEWAVPFEPARLVVDPDALVLQRSRVDLRLPQARERFSSSAIGGKRSQGTR